MNPVLIRAGVEQARQRPWLFVAAAVVSSPLLLAALVLMFMTALLVGGTSGTVAASADACTPQVPDNLPTVSDLTRKQVGYAAVIIDRGRAAHVPPFGWEVGIAVAMQESGLSNPASSAVPESLHYPHDWVAAGDHDSVGIMQQRASWGSVKSRMDPAASIDRFYTGGDGGEPGLLDVPGWEDMALTDAAQAVQRSAFGAAYAAHEQTAAALVEQLSNVDVGTCGTEATGKWVDPVDPDGNGKPAYVNANNFGDCGSLWADCHTGDDLSGIDHVPVHAAGDGVVSYAAFYGSDSYGWLVIIDHAAGVQTYYAHNTSLLVAAGDHVTAGQQIAVSGDTGNTTGPHVHFEVRLDGIPVDPVPWMADHHAPLQETG